MRYSPSKTAPFHPEELPALIGGGFAVDDTCLACGAGVAGLLAV